MLVEEFQDARSDFGPGFGVKQGHGLVGDAIGPFLNVVAFPLVSGIEGFVGMGGAVVVEVLGVLRFAQ